LAEQGRNDREGLLCTPPGRDTLISPRGAPLSSGDERRDGDAAAIRRLEDLSCALDLDVDSALRLLDEEVRELREAVGNPGACAEELNDTYFALFNLSRVLLGRHRQMDGPRMLDKIERRLETYATIGQRTVRYDDEELFRRIDYDVVNFAFGNFKHPWKRFDAFKNGTEAELAELSAKALVSRTRRGNHAILTFSDVPEIQVSFLTTSWSTKEGNTALIKIPCWLYDYCRKQCKLEEYESLIAAQITAVLDLLPLSENPIFHFHSWESGVLVTSDFRWPGKRVFSPYLTVGRLRELMLSERSDDWTLSEELAEIATRYERRLVAFCDQVVVESERDRSFYSRLSSGARITKVTFIPAEISSFEVRLARQDRYRLITGGRAVREKGFDLLITMLPALEDALDARVELQVVCREKSRTTGLEKYQGYVRLMHDLAARLGVADRVSILEKVSIGELEAMIAGSDCLVVPSRYDPFCLLPIHGWRVAKPVLVSRETGIAEHVDDPRFLFDPYSATDLARRLDGLIGQTIEFRLARSASRDLPSIYLD